MSYGAEDPIAHASWTSNAILQPTTEEEFRAVYSDRDLFYAVLKGPTETVIRDHLAGGTQNNPPDFDGGLYAYRIEGQRYLCSVGIDYPRNFIGLSLPFESVETPQIQVSRFGPILA